MGQSIDPCGDGFKPGDHVLWVIAKNGGISVPLEHVQRTLWQMECT